MFILPAWMPKAENLVLSMQIEILMPYSGMDLYLTLDYSFQQFAESLMVDIRGAIVALDPRNGRSNCYLYQNQIMILGCFQAKFHRRFGQIYKTIPAQPLL